METNTTCPLLEQYLGYLIVIKARSEYTIKGYRTDILTFFMFVMSFRNTPLSERDFAFADIEFIKAITLGHPEKPLVFQEQRLRRCKHTGIYDFSCVLPDLPAA